MRAHPVRSLLVALFTLVAVVSCGASSNRADCGTASKAKPRTDNSCDRFIRLPCSIQADAKEISEPVCVKECPRTENGTKALSCGIERDAQGLAYLGCSYCQI